MLQIYANGMFFNSNSEEIRRVKYYITFLLHRKNPTFIMMVMMEMIKMMVIDFSANIVCTIVKHDKQQTEGRFFHVPY